MSDEQEPIELDLRDGVRHGLIAARRDRVVTITVLDPDGIDDEWYFPAEMVPTEIEVGTRVLLTGSGLTLQVTASTDGDADLTPSPTPR